VLSLSAPPAVSIDSYQINPLDSKGNSATKLVHWPLTGGLLHLVQRGGAWAGCGPAQSHPRCTKCNSPPINGQCVSLDDGPLLCGFNVAIKGLTSACYRNARRRRMMHAPPSSLLLLIPHNFRDTRSHTHQLILQKLIRTRCYIVHKLFHNIGFVLMMRS